jgi:F-type H+-transporting ATPase subunit c
MRKSTIFFLAFACLLLATPVYAQGTEPAAAATNWVAITSGFAIALAAGLAALGQGRVAGSAAEAMARNPGARPGIQLVLILGLAFIESLVLFTFAMIFAKVK